MQTGEFLSIVFDATLKQRLTRPFLSYLYVVLLALAGLHALLIVWCGFSSGVWSALGSCILAPVAFVVYAIAARVAVELLIAVLRIAENTSALTEGAEGAGTEDI